MTSSSPSATAREFELGVFGATGFTGERIALHLARLQQQGRYKVPILLAGRDELKLRGVATRINSQCDGKAQLQIMAGILTEDAASLVRFTQRVRVAINAVGPYRFHGEPVVKACLSTAAHYTDVTGEPEFIERMIASYDEEARNKGLLFVPCCGFDSIPSDLGAIYAAEQLKKRHPSLIVSRIDAFISLNSGPAGMKGNVGTWHTLVHGLSNAAQLKQVRKQLKAKYAAEGGAVVPRFGRAIKPKLVYWETRLQRWALIFPGADAAVVRNSQTQLTINGSKEVQPYYNICFTLPSIIQVILFLLWAAMLKLMTIFSFTRQLLLDHPAVFSFGGFSFKGPSQQQLDHTSCVFDFFAFGQSANSSAADNQEQSIHTRIVMPEPGYVATPVCVVSAALSILQVSTLPRGVLTPGAAFSGDPSMIEKLDRSGVKFAVVD